MIGNLFLVIDPFTAIAVGSAIAGLVGSVASSHMNRKAQRETNAMQLRAQQATNAFNAAEAQKERDWNDYSNQSDRMRAAGLNPSLMFGGQGSPVNSGAVASGSGVPGLTSPTFDFGQNQIGSFADIAAALQSVANAKKAGVDTKFLRDTLEYRVRSEAANSVRNEVLSDIDKRYADEKAQKELKVISNTIDKLSEEIDVMVAQEGLINEQTLSQMYDTFKNKIDFLEKEKLYNAKDALGDFWDKFVIATLQKLQNEGRLAGVQADWLPRQVKAQETSANAAMVTATANAEDLRATRAARINNMNADAREKNSLAAINDYELDTRPSEIIASWHNFVDMVTTTVSATTSVDYLKKELDQIGYEIELAKKHNDWYLVDQLMDNAKDIAISIGSVAIARKNFGGAGKARPVGFKNY